MEKQATFGAGCFWGVEAAFRQLDGVTKTEVGYEGGTLDNPTYEDVCSHKTGHAEVVRVTYDPERISYDDLLQVFWGKHDPTQLNRQGWDVGDQYRSAIFTHDAEQEEIAARSKAEEQTRPQEARRHADRALDHVLRRRGLPPAVPREARPLELHAGATARGGRLTSRTRVRGRAARAHPVRTGTHSAPTIAPRGGARAYTQKSCHSPETSAGPNDRAGFIDAPVTGPPNRASSPMTPPIAIAAEAPTARVSVATAMITNMRKVVSTTSYRNACPAPTLGTVAPRFAGLSVQATHRTPAAALAPTSWAGM